MLASPPDTNAAAAFAVAGAIIGAFRSKSAIGGWLFFFLWGAIVGSFITTLSLSADQFNMLPSHWKDQTKYLIHLLSVCPRIASVWVVAAISIALIRYHEWRWIQMLKIGLVAYLITQTETALIDAFVFPSARDAAVVGLFYPIVFLIYLRFSQRVVSVFKNHDWNTAP